MVGATHCQTGPVIPADPSCLTSNPSYLKRRQVDPKSKGRQILFDYITKLPGLITESIIKANATLKPAKVSFGQGHEESISFNRRYFMTDDTVGWNPGLHNPKIDRKAYAEGNYEPISQNTSPGSGEILVENALRMLNELKY